MVKTKVHIVILMILASLLIGLILCEIILRAAHIRPRAEQKHLNSWAEPDAILGWRMRPGIWYVDWENQPMTVKADHRRKVCFQGAIAEYTPEIIFQGDSIMCGFGVSDEASTASQLQARLPRIRVRNHATPGFSTYQTLLDLEAQFAKGNHGYSTHVVYGFADNNQWRNTASHPWVRSLSSYDGSHIFPPHVVLAGDGTLIRFPFEKRNLFGLSEMSDVLWLIEDFQIRKETADRIIPAFYRNVTQILIRQIQDLCKRNNIELLILFTLFNKSELEIYKKFCNDNNIMFVDGTRDYIRWGDPKFFLGDDGKSHPREQVHRMWADDLCQFFGTGPRLFSPCADAQ